MSQIAYYMGRQFPTLSLTISLLLALFSAIPAVAAEPDRKPEIVERETFIRKAMEEQKESIVKKVEEMHRQGIYPEMIISKLVPFGDWDFYFVQGDSIYWQPNQGQKFKPVTVPSGFVTDLASIPRLFWQVHRPEGRYAFAAVVHDYLYWTQTRPREEADQIFKIAMEDSKVDSRTIETLYQAVRALGQSSWDNNSKLRKAGERRVLRRFPKDFTISWSDWKKQPEVFDEE